MSQPVCIPVQPGRLTVVGEFPETSARHSECNDPGPVDVDHPALEEAERSNDSEGTAEAVTLDVQTVFRIFQVSARRLFKPFPD